MEVGFVVWRRRGCKHVVGANVDLISQSRSPFVSRYLTLPDTSLLIKQIKILYHSSLLV